MDTGTSRTVAITFSGGGTFSVVVRSAYEAEAGEATVASLTEAQGDALMRRALAMPELAAQMHALTDAALPIDAEDAPGRAVRCRGGRVYSL